MKKTFLALGLLATSFAVTFAQFSISVGNGGGSVVIGNGASQNVGGNLLSLLATAQTIVNRLLPFGIGLAVVALVFGIAMFIIKGTKDGGEHDKWLKFIGMSLVGIFVMVSIWGLIGFMGSVLGIGQGGSVPVPSIPTGPNAG